MYRVHVDKSARKSALALPPHHLDRIEQALLRLVANPRPVGARKLGNRLGWRIRVGDYRVLYEIDDSAQLVHVFEIAHRKDAYR